MGERLRRGRRGVSAVTEKAVELFLERERAEAFLAEVERDEPETAALLRVKPIEPDGFSASTNLQAPRRPARVRAG